MRFPRRLFAIFPLYVLSYLSYGWVKYSESKTMYLPYLDMSGTHWSEFYTRIPADQKAQPLSVYIAENSWLEERMDIAQDGDASSMESILYSRLQAMDNGQVVFDYQLGGDRVVVFRGVEENGPGCLVGRYTKAKDFYRFINDSSTLPHHVGGIMSTQCNSTGDFSAEEASFTSFVFYELLDCFSYCKEKSVIVYRNKLFPFEKGRALQSIRRYLKEREDEYQGVHRELDEIDLGINRVIAGGNQCFIDFDYQNPVLGRLNFLAHLECSSGELVDIDNMMIGMDNMHGIAHYFYGTEEQKTAL